MGSSAPPYLNCGISRFSADIWHLIQTFSINTVVWFWFRATDEVVRLLMRVCYPKGSSRPISNVLSDLINGTYCFASPILIIVIWNTCMPKTDIIFNTFIIVRIFFLNCNLGANGQYMYHFKYACNFYNCWFGLNIQEPIRSN